MVGDKAVARDARGAEIVADSIGVAAAGAVDDEACSIKTMLSSSSVNSTDGWRDTGSGGGGGGVDADNGGDGGDGGGGAA